MQETKILINNIPAVIYGDKKDNVYLFIHGKCGFKEEAKDFAEIICQKGYTVIGIDLPGHGERKNEMESFVPWEVVPELTQVMNYLKENYSTVSLRANSIGAYFSMLAFKDIKIDKCFFVSPLVDMFKLINNMMYFSSVTIDELAKKKTIPTNFGETLSYEYYCYAKDNLLDSWNNQTYILYGTKDNMTDYETIKSFSDRFKCNLSIMENGEHWFHTKEQLKFMNNWIKANI